MSDILGNIFCHSVQLNPAFVLYSIGVSETKITRSMDVGQTPDTQIHQT